jgi:hypothetical protein
MRLFAAQAFRFLSHLTLHNATTISITYVAHNLLAISNQVAAFLTSRTIELDIHFHRLVLVTGSAAKIACVFTEYGVPAISTASAGIGAVAVMRPAFTLGFSRRHIW